MKYSLFCSLVVFTSLPGIICAQGSWVSYSQVFQTQGYEGHRFRLEAAIRVEIEDDSTTAHLWARVDIENGIGFFDNMGNRPVNSREWKIKTIEGKIDSGATQLAFGIWCQYNGAFFLDEVKLSVETDKDKWIPVFTDGFEAAGLGTWKQGVRRWEENKSGLNSLSQATTVAANPFHGKRCLKIINKGLPTYGINSKAGQYLLVNGIRIYCETYGEGQPLVLLHTAGSSIGDATPFMIDLVKKYKVIAFDLRGHGKSGDTDADYSYDQMADDIAKALIQMKIDSAYISGFSDGATIGLLLAVNHPELVKKLLAVVPNILCDTTAIPAIIYQVLEKSASAASPSQDRKLSRWMFSSSGLSFEKLTSIRCPVLLVTGDRDAVRLEHTLKIFQSIPRSQLSVIPGATHRSPWEQKEFFLQLATDFFDKPFSRPDTLDWFKE